MKAELESQATTSITRDLVDLLSMIGDIARLTNTSYKFRKKDVGVSIHYIDSHEADADFYIYVLVDKNNRLDIICSHKPTNI